MDAKIYLAYINRQFPPQWQNLIRDISQSIPWQFNLMTVPIDLQLYYSDTRNQYHSTLILAQLLKLLPADGAKIVGITDVDLFIPILTFLFGEAQFNGSGAVVSTYRLHNQFYGLPPDEGLFYHRTLKEILHELGHTLGLIHCQQFECVMRSSTYVEDIDLKHARFCERCQGLVLQNENGAL